VQGVDESPDMLDLARTKVPDAQFSLGDLRSLPLPSDSIGLDALPAAAVRAAQLASATVNRA
jgi:trans-aconitate methyltransferase